MAQTKNIHHSFLENLRKLREKPYNFALEKVTKIREHKELVNDILHETGTRSQMMVNYFKHVSDILALISVVPNGNII